ncbi:MAG: LysE family translocator [Salinibacterium sp.]|nr:LysE family translocator [Salinibacterium sp.]
MIPAVNLIAFVLVAIPIILLPGPSVLFVIGRSLSLGRVGGLLSVVGNAAGGFVTVVAVALGIGLVIAESVVVFTIVKIVGAGYLIYLGVQAIRHRRQRADAATARVSPTAPWKLLVQGFLVGVSNPKTIVFFIAVLPQFVDYGAGGVPLQLLALGGLFVTIALLTDSVWALAAGVARDWFAKSPRRISTLSATGGVMMIGLGTASLFLGHGKQ